MPVSCAALELLGMTAVLLFLTKIGAGCLPFVLLCYSRLNIKSDV